MSDQSTKYWDAAQPDPRPRKNPAAVALGRRAKGVPKNYTPDEIEKRTKRLKEAAKRRWPNGRKDVNEK